jgi:rhodanese-related sulfurtransferase
MYKGNVTPAEAFARLSSDSRAVLIDVRTQPEWAFVGVPLVERLVRLSWQAFPSMQVDPDFADKVRAAGVSENDEVFLICRSGARSAAAANALTAAGFAHCHNVAQGFEGDRDAEGHRGTVGGWKAAGLPWAQS